MGDEHAAAVPAGQRAGRDGGIRIRHGIRHEFDYQFVND
jgi:hypothetical protein